MLVGWVVLVGWAVLGVVFLGLVGGLLPFLFDHFLLVLCHFLFFPDRLSHSLSQILHDLARLPQLFLQSFALPLVPLHQILPSSLAFDLHIKLARQSQAHLRFLMRHIIGADLNGDGGGDILGVEDRGVFGFGLIHLFFMSQIFPTSSSFFFQTAALCLSRVSLLPDLYVCMVSHQDRTCDFIVRALWEYPFM